MPLTTMTTLEQKQADIEMFLSEKEALKRLRLERIITGKRKPREYILPVTFTVLAAANLLLLGVSRSLDGGTLLMVGSLIMAVGAWSRLETETLQRQIKALKEYCDLRMAEKADKPKMTG